MTNDLIKFSTMRKNGWTKKMIDIYGLEPTITFIQRGNKKQTFKRSKKVVLYNRDEVLKIQNTKGFSKAVQEYQLTREKSKLKQLILDEIESDYFFGVKCAIQENLADNELNSEIENLRKQLNDYQKLWLSKVREVSTIQELEKLYKKFQKSREN